MHTSSASPIRQVAIVTGASRGIGAATAQLLARQQFAVCVNYRSNHEAAHNVVASIRQHGGQAISYQADVTDENQVAALFEETRNTFGEVTHLVNNAGVLQRQTRLENIDSDRFQNILLGNVMGTFLCCRAFIRQAAEGAAIVNVSSAAARTGAPLEYIDYAAAKGAIDSLTKGLSVELAARNIRVNAVRPGFIHTDMHRDGGEPERVSRLAPTIPLKRGGTAEEVAQAIYWLLSQEASYVTGSFIDIAGGR